MAKVTQQLNLDMIWIQDGTVRHIQCGELTNGQTQETVRQLPAPDPSRMEILEQRRKWRAQKRAAYQKRRGLENRKFHVES
jgi:uncharacterized membrane protein (UPF0127 family)